MYICSLEVSVCVWMASDEQLKSQEVPQISASFLYSKALTCLHAQLSWPGEEARI